MSILPFLDWTYVDGKWLDKVTGWHAPGQKAYEGYYLSSVAPWEAIVDAAKKKKCDLICIGSRGMSALGKALVGRLLDVE